MSGRYFSVTAGYVRSSSVCEQMAFQHRLPVGLAVQVAAEMTRCDAVVGAVEDGIGDALAPRIRGRPDVDHGEPRIAGLLAAQEAEDAFARTVRREHPALRRPAPPRHEQEIDLEDRAVVEMREAVVLERVVQPEAELRHLADHGIGERAAGVVRG